MVLHLTNIEETPMTREESFRHWMSQLLAMRPNEQLDTLISEATKLVQAEAASRTPKRGQVPLGRVSVLMDEGLMPREVATQLGMSHSAAQSAFGRIRRMRGLVASPERVAGARRCTAVRVARRAAALDAAP